MTQQRLTFDLTYYSWLTDRNQPYMTNLESVPWQSLEPLTNLTSSASQSQSMTVSPPHLTTFLSLEKPCDQVLRNVMWAVPFPLCLFILYLSSRPYPWAHWRLQGPYHPGFWDGKCAHLELFFGWECTTPWTVAHQTPLSMEFSRQEYWSG